MGMDQPSRRDDLFIVSVVLSAIAVLFSIVGVGLGVRAIDESKDNLAAAAGGRGGDTREAGPTQTIDIAAQNVAFSKAALSVGAGAVTIAFDNQDDGIPHNLHVTGSGIDEKTEIEAGPTAQTLKLELEAGRYSYVCDVHPQQMKGDLEVT